MAGAWHQRKCLDPSADSLPSYCLGRRNAMPQEAQQQQFPGQPPPPAFPGTIPAGSTDSVTAINFPPRRTTTITVTITPTVIPSPSPSTPPSPPQQTTIPSTIVTATPQQPSQTSILTGDTAYPTTILRQSTPAPTAPSVPRLTPTGIALPVEGQGLTPTQRNGIIGGVASLVFITIGVAFFFIFRKGKQSPYGTNGSSSTENLRNIDGGSGGGRKEPGDSFIAYMNPPQEISGPESLTGSFNSADRQGALASMPIMMAAGMKNSSNRGSDETLVKVPPPGTSVPVPTPEYSFSNLNFGDMDPSNLGFTAAVETTQSNRPKSPSASLSSQEDMPKFSPSGLTPIRTTPPSPGGSSTNSIPTYTYTTLHGWTPQRSDELSLVPGDSVAVYQVFEDGWCEGVCERTGGVGVFPVACLRDPRQSEFYSDTEKVKRLSEKQRSIAGSVSSFFDGYKSGVTNATKSIVEPQKRFSSIYTNVTGGGTVGRTAKENGWEDDDEAEEVVVV